MATISTSTDQRKPGRPPAKLLRRTADRTGLRFGRLVVLSRAGSVADGRSTWLCRCDCGTEQVVQWNFLRGGLRQSCGCSQRNLPDAPRPKRPYRLPPGYAARNTVLAVYKNGAAARGLEWRLSVEEFTAIATGDCVYCGSKPVLRRKKARANGDFVYNGIDRFNTRLGYTKENSVSCCTNCNRAKADLTFNEFTAWIQRLAAHLATVDPESRGAA